MSETKHGSLVDALGAFQAEAPKLFKGSQAGSGKFAYKYIALDDIMAIIQPLLTKHGLVWSTYPAYGPDHSPALAYSLSHHNEKVNDEVSGLMPLLVQKPDPQGLGSAITYARRYALTSILNLVADDDDDAQRATAPAKAAAAKPKVASPRATPQQIKGLQDLADELGLSPTDLADAICYAAGRQIQGFSSMNDAAVWVGQMLPQFPAHLVPKVEEKLRAMTGQQVPA